MGATTPNNDPAPEPDAKAVLRADRSGHLHTDTYWGGAGRADGPGHGHAVVDESGDVHYLRESAADQPGKTRNERVTRDDRARDRSRDRRR